MRQVITRRSLGIVALCAISLVGCGLLAWWQWTRYTSASGTLQNLGYVLQWPLFGAFPAFMFWRLHKAARERAAESTPQPSAKVDNRATALTPSPTPSSMTSPKSLVRRESKARPEQTSTQPRSRLAYVPATQSDDGDEVHRAYNSYLAELNRAQLNPAESNAAELNAQEDRHAGH